MNKNKYLINLALISFTLSSSNLSAKDFVDELFEQEPSLNYSLTLGISNDSSNSKTYDLSLELSINDSTQFLFYSEYFDINDTNIDFDSRSYDIGIFHQATDSIGFGANFINSGQQGHLTSKTFRGSFSYYTENWGGAISPEKSTIKLNNIRREITQTGIGASINYYATNSLEFSFTRVQYEYNRNLRLINRLFINRIITIQTLSLANNYYDNYFILGLKYDFDNFSARYYYSQSLSAIDLKISKTNSFNIYYPLGRAISLDLTAGSNQQENLEKSSFTRFAVGYHW